MRTGAETCGEATGSSQEDEIPGARDRTVTCNCIFVNIDICASCSAHFEQSYCSEGATRVESILSLVGAVAIAAAGRIDAASIGPRS